MVFYLSVLASMGFLVWTFRNVLFWTVTFRHESYSFRRVRDYIVASASGRELLYSRISYIKWALILLYPLVIFRENISELYYLSISLVYLYEVITVIRDAISRRLIQRKDLTKKTVAVCILAMLGIVGLFLLPPVDGFLWLLIVDRLSFLVVLLVTFLVGLPEELYWEYRGMKQVENSNPEVIMLIGNREIMMLSQYITHVLSKKDSVLMLSEPANKKRIIRTLVRTRAQKYQYIVVPLLRNSLEDLEDILASITVKYAVVVVEAMQYNYKKSGVSEARMLSLLLENLPNDGKVFLYPDNQKKTHTKDMQKNVHRMKRSRVIDLKKTKTTFTYPEVKGSFETRLISELGPYYLSTVMPLLSHLGVPSVALKSSTKEATPPNDFLDVRELNGVLHLSHTFEDDLRRLPLLSSYVSLHRHKKILILDVGRVRLSQVELRHILRQISSVYAYVFLLDASLAKSCKYMLTTAEKDLYVTIASKKQIAVYIRSLATKEDLVVFFGEEAKEVRIRLTDNS